MIDHELQAFHSKAIAVPEGRLVAWQGYVERLAGGEPRGAGSSCVWRCEIWTEGLFSLVFWALGFLESRTEEDICDSYICHMSYVIYIIYIYIYDRIYIFW